MAEDTARAVGAPSPTVVMINGKEVKPRALSLKELGTIERDCLQRYRRQYLQTWHDNLDLLSDAARDKTMQQKIEEVSLWDMSNLPVKLAVDWKKVKLTQNLRLWVDNYLQDVAADAERPQGSDAIDRFYKKIAAAMVDQEVMSDSEYKNLTGADSPKVKVPFVTWWATGTLDGQITMLWQCAASSGITREEVESDPLVLRNPQLLLQIVQEIETLTAPELGNG